MDIPESSIVLAYSDQHPTIKTFDNTTNTVDYDGNISTYEYIFLTLGGVSTVLLQALSIVLLGIGRLPEFFQVPQLIVMITTNY